MSDVGLDADLTLDIRSSLDQVARLAAQLESALSNRIVTVTADTSAIADEVTAAIDAANDQVVVEGDARELTGDVDAALDAADTEVEVTSNAGEVTGDIDAAVDAADTEVVVEGEADDVRAAIDDAIDGADTKVPILGDADPLKESIRDGLGEGEKEAPAAGSQTGGAFASGFSRSVSAALRSLPKVEVGADSSEAQREIAGVRDQLLRLQDETIGLTISDSDALAELGRIQERLNEIGGENVSASVAVDIGSAQAALSQVSAQLDRVDSSVAAVGASASEASGGVDDLDDSLSNVDEGLVVASASGGNLSRVFKALAAAGVAKGLFDAAQAASDLSESTSKATVVFGEGVDQVQEFAAAADEAAGLSESAALEAAATFGNLFVALGATKDQAVDLAPAVVQLGADLASFNNLAVDETLEKLRSGLVGEVEPLRSLGISFNAAQVEAKAMELGLQDANGTISEGAKLQARWALILEQSGTAQGDFARTSSGLANQQRILTAEFQNAVTSLGQQLLPALLDGVQVAREDLIPAFSEVGSSLLPAIARAFVSILPVAGSFTNILVALAPVVTAVANGIAGLPPELITLIGLFAAVRRFLPTDAFGKLTESITQAAASEVGLSGSIKAGIGNFVAANAATIGLSLGLAVVGLALEENAQKAAEFRRHVADIKSALDTALTPGTKIVDALADTFDALVEKGDNASVILAQAGVTGDEFATTVAKSTDRTQAWATQLGLAADELGVLKPFLDTFSDQLDQAAKQQVNQIRASGELSDSFVDQAIAAETTKTAYLGMTVSSTDYVGVLGTLVEAQNAATAEIGTTVDEAGNLVEAVGPAADAADRLALSLAQVTQHGGDTGLELTGLAQAAGDARVAEEDLQNVADTLGVSLDDLKSFVSSVNDSINQFADDTLDTIPSIGDLIGDLGDDFSPEALLDKLEDATEGIANFQTNLDALAAFPHVQQIAATNGPLVAAALAKPIEDGNTEILQQLEDQAAAFDLHYAGLDDDLRNRLGPELADATGVTAAAATDAFGENFKPEQEAIIASHGAEIAVANAAPAMGEAATEFGKSGTAGFSTGVGGMPVAGGQAADDSISAVNARNFAANLAGALFGRGIADPFADSVGKMPVATSDSGKKSISAVNAQGPFATLAGQIFGSSFAIGTSSGAKGMSTAAGSAADAAVSKVSSKAKAASGAGYSIGIALGSGMQSGINSAAASVGQAAADMVANAIAKAKAKAQIGSPSRVFAELGGFMAEGMALGIEAETDTVASAAAEVIAEAERIVAASTLDLTPSVEVASVSPTLGLSNGSATSTAGSEGNVSITVAAGAIQVNAGTIDSTARAQVVGRGIAQGLTAELAIQSRRIRTNATTGG